MTRKYGSKFELGSYRYMLLYVRHKMRLHPRKVLIAIVVTFFLLWFIRYWRFQHLEWDFDDDDTLGHVRDPGLKHDKWIIVTTINQPTDALKALNNLPGWKLLVVGDRKTPKNWELTGVKYLNTAAQKKLGYKVHPLLPYDSYTRKIIGYLYAIEHGAEYIYDTDDDNSPTSGPDAFQLSLGHIEGLVTNTKNLTYNPYRHFGQSTIWPRGYPHEYIGLPVMQDYHLCNVHVPAIQQGLVSGDPDVDAVFRLTRHHGKGRLDLKFDSGAPPVVLPKGTFAPMNSQNTLFTGKALWGLLLPTTVSQRATDIYRAYWAQRLLWLLGENVGFFPPNSHQKRNPHSNLMDAREEAELYQNTGHLVRFLHGWTCTGMFFFDCASQLAKDMVGLGFWTHRDAELVDAWITDLATVGYAPPSLKIRDMCVNDKKLSVVFYPDEQNTSLPHSSVLSIPPDLTNHESITQHLTKTCGTSPAVHYTQMINYATKYDNLVLVVGVHDTENIPLIEAAHRPHFPHIIYCSSALLNQKFFHSLHLSYIVTSEEETTGPGCVHAVMMLHHAVAGYLYISDHAWITDSKTNLPIKQPNLMWVTGEVDIYKPEMEELCQLKTLQCQPITKDLMEHFISEVPSIQGETKFKSELRQCLVKFASDPNFLSKPQLMWITDSSFYIPSRLKDMVEAVGQLFTSNRSKRKYDFLTPLLLECLELTVEYLQYVPLAEFQNSKEAHYILPFNFKGVTKLNHDSDYRTHFCQHFQNWTP